MTLVSSASASTDPSSDRPILVTAATGTTGRRLVTRLAERGAVVRPASRRAPRDGAPDGAVVFDWNDPATHAPALAGVRAASIVYSPDLSLPEAATAIESFVRAAERAGVERLVLLSGRGEPGALRCESIVRASSIPSVVVRAAWFMQNFSEGALRDLVLAGAVALPVGGTGEPFVDADDIADVMAEALVDRTGRLDGEVLEVTGPAVCSFDDAIATIARANDRPIAFHDVPLAAFVEGMRASGAPEEMVELTAYLMGTLLDGRNESVGDGVRRALGRAPRSIATFARDAAAAGAWDGGTSATRREAS